MESPFELEQTSYDPGRVFLGHPGGEVAADRGDGQIDRRRPRRLTTRDRDSLSSTGRFADTAELDDAGELGLDPRTR